MFAEQPRGNLRISREGKLMEVDEVGARLFGFDSPSEMLGTELKTLIPDVCDASWLSQPRPGECRCRHKSGSVWTALIDPRAGDRPGEMTLTIEDARDQANDLVVGILDALPNIVFFKDRDHRSLFVNARFCEFTGLRREDVLGKTDLEFIPKAEADVFGAIDDAVFETGRTWENEECFTDAAGGKHTFITRKSVHTDPRGRQVLLGVSTDITERKEAEEALGRARDELERKVLERTRDLNETNRRLQHEIAELQRARERLRESEERYRAVFETTGTANVVLDENGRITLANEGFAQLVGSRRADLESERALADFVEEAQRDRLAMHLRAHSSEPCSFELRLRSRDGRLRDGIATLSVMLGRSDRLVSILDVTERKRANEELFRAEKMAALGQIIAGVAHEINNPNNFVHFNLPILRRYVDAIRPLVEQRLAAEPDLRLLGMPAAAFVEDVDRLIDNMQHGSQRITGIVAELKNYVRNQEGEERRPGSVETVIEHVMTLVGKQVRKMVKRLEVEVAAPLPRVVMNSGQMEQVIINLLINAAQAADKEESWVKLVARAGDGADRVEVAVSDNGCGIAQEVAAHMFDPFFTTKEREGGTGLGLSIVQRIVSEHGGSVDVRSEEKVGSTFTVVLLAAREAEP